MHYAEPETVPPLHGGIITIAVTAADLELALACQGENLKPKLMAAIYAVLAVDPIDL